MDWHLIISLATLVLVIFTIVWGTGLWIRREKITITYPQMLVKLETGKSTGIQFECWFHLTYVKGTRDHYVGKIFIEFNKRPWKKLSSSFAIPMRICKGIGSLDTPVKLELGKPTPFGYDDFFPARRAISEEERKELNSFVQTLCYRYKTGWEDAYGKTHWKTINQLKEIEKRGIL